jgi:hypothetical protein
MKGAQLGLRRRRLSAPIVMRGTVIVVPVRGERVTEVPYGMGYGGELRAEQQKRAGQMQKSASHLDDSTPGVKPPASRTDVRVEFRDTTGLLLNPSCRFPIFRKCAHDSPTALSQERGQLGIAEHRENCEHGYSHILVYGLDLGIRHSSGLAPIAKGACHDGNGCGGKCQDLPKTRMPIHQKTNGPNDGIDPVLVPRIKQLRAFLHVNKFAQRRQRVECIRM